MKKYIMMLVVLMTTMFAMNASAFNPPPAPANGGYVVDMAGKLTLMQILDLNQKIDKISKSTKNEFGVLLLQDMGGENIEDVANATYKSWGVGKKGLDNGCLIVVSVKERKSRIETGKGVEGEVTDLQASDILKAHLNPHLKSGDFYGGFDDTLSTLSSLMESRQAQGTQPAARDANCSVGLVGANTVDEFNPVLPIGLLLVGLMIATWILVRWKKRDQEAAMKRFRDEQDRRDMYLAKARARAARTEPTLLTPKLKPMPPVRAPVAADRDTYVPMAFRSSTKKTTTKKTTKVEPTCLRFGCDSMSPLAGCPVHDTKKATKPVAKPVVQDDSYAKAFTKQQEESRKRREREEEEEDRRARRRRDEESSSSSSGFGGWGGGSDSGSDSGGGFGGGDSGGGGSSSDW